MPASGYLVFRPDESGHYPQRSSEIWTGAAPIPGENIPDNCKAIPWVILEDNINPLDYYRTNQNSLILLPQTDSN